MEVVDDDSSLGPSELDEEDVSVSGVTVSDDAVCVKKVVTEVVLDVEVLWGSSAAMRIASTARQPVGASPLSGTTTRALPSKQNPSAP